MDRPHSIFPVVARNEVAAGVTDHGDIEFLDQIEDILAEAHIVGCGVVLFVYAAIDRAAQMLDKRAINAWIDITDSEVLVQYQPGFYLIRH